MNPIEHVLHFLLNMLFPRRDIIIDERLYLRRWYVWFGKTRRVFLHCILRADDQRVLHDHPWEFETYILARGYTEKLTEGAREVRFLDHLKHPADHAHAVAPDKGPAWTLMIAKPATRIWGFNTDEGWMDWRSYLLEHNAPDHREDVIDYVALYGSHIEAYTKLMRSRPETQKARAQRDAQLRALWALLNDTERGVVTVEEKIQQRANVDW